MAHKYMVYTRDNGGVITRQHRTVTLDDVSQYHDKENLSGWPEKCVFWQRFNDGSATGIAPISDRVEKKITHYSTGIRSANRVA